LWDKGESITSLDTHTPNWRATYFLRNAVRTLWEIKSALSSLRDNRQFRKALQKLGDSHYNRFMGKIRELDRNIDLLRELRNALGGHVSRDSVRAGLESLPPLSFAKFEFGRKTVDADLEYARLLCYQILYHGVPEDQLAQHLEKILKLNLDVFMVIHIAFTAYLIDRQLIP
jgi:hypothetical protein